MYYETKKTFQIHHLRSCFICVIHALEEITAGASYSSPETAEIMAVTAATTVVAAAAEIAKGTADAVP